jgi:hypothetical protein
MSGPLDPRDDPTSLGRILLDARVVTPWQISEAVALTLTDDEQKKRLGDALVELGYATQADVDWAVDIQGTARESDRGEKVRRTLDLVASATAQIAPLTDSIADAADRASDIVRRFRMRRVTVKL